MSANIGGRERLDIAIGHDLADLPGSVRDAFDRIGPGLVEGRARIVGSRDGRLLASVELSVVVGIDVDGHSWQARLREYGGVVVIDGILEAAAVRIDRGGSRDLLQFRERRRRADTKGLRDDVVGGERRHLVGDVAAFGRNAIGEEEELS